MQSFSKEERVHKVFEKIYDNYDTMNSVISFKQHLRWRKDTMKRMRVKPGDSALDLCCGTADWTIALAKKTGVGSEIVGLDFSQGMLSVGAKKVKEAGLNHRVRLVQGNAMSLPFEDNLFDFVTIGFGLRNTPDYLTVIKEMHRVLKPGGLAVCMDTSQPTLPVYKQLFQLYFTYFMPLAGKMFAKSYLEYTWLHESTKNFVSKKELQLLFEQAGFKNVYYRSYSGGVAATHFGTKEK